MEDGNDNPDPGCLGERSGPSTEHAQQPQEAADQMDDEWYANKCRIEDIRSTHSLIKSIHNAKLGDAYCKLGADFVDNLRNPPTEPLAIDDADLRLSIDIYLATTTASQETYNRIRDGILRRYPDCKMLSFDCVKRRVAEMSGVYPIVHDMCVNSCMAFTGIWERLDRCPMCEEPRYKEQAARNTPRQHFYTLPIGPQLQALWRSPEGARNIRYRERRTKELLDELENTGGDLSTYDDILCGGDYLEEVISGKIQAGDMVLMLSIDGAQLYQSKMSDTWIYIWVVVDHAPDVRYKKKHVLPGGFIPGPHPPKNLDSFLFPGLHHLSAIQNEGLKIWDAHLDHIFTSNVFFLLACADALGMAPLSGLVGHHGKQGCRLFCPLPGRHKPGLPQYYPARLKPDNYTLSGCDHGDFPLSDIIDSDNAPERYAENLKYVVTSPNKTRYNERRKATGICKPTIFSGLSRRLQIPKCFGLDVMHLPAINIPDLLLGLWRAVFECGKGDDRSTWTWAVLVGGTWKDHGKQVAQCTPYLPGSFDRPPRNPAEKINSGYKAWEWLLYLYGLGPALFYNVLPPVYWRHYCKLVFGIRIINQREISREQLLDAHTALTDFAEGFEELYYNRKASRLHFCRPAVHTVRHLASEVTRLGPGICSSQWTMERTIGNLGEEVKQHSNPFANLSQRGLRRSQVNALKAMVPDLEQRKDNLPRGAVDLGNGYALLRARDRYEYTLRPPEAAAVDSYLQEAGVLGECRRII